MNKPSYVVTWCILMIGSGCAETPVKTDALSSSEPKFTEFTLRAWVVASEKAGQDPRLYWEKTGESAPKGLLLMLVRPDKDSAPSPTGEVKGRISISIMPPHPPMELQLFPPGDYHARICDGSLQSRQMTPLSNWVRFEIKRTQGKY